MILTATDDVVCPILTERQPNPTLLQSEPHPVYRRFTVRNQGDIVGRLRRAREELSEIFPAVSGDLDDNRSARTCNECASLSEPIESPTLGTSPMDEHTAPAATVTVVAAPMADFSPRAGLKRRILILEQINRDNSQDMAQAVPEEDINISCRRRRERLERLASRHHASLYAENSNGNNEGETAAEFMWIAFDDIVD